MDWKQKYEAALEAAKAGKSREEIFPELAESEDERIRKALIGMVENQRGTWLIPENKDKMLAYLEKQKKQKPAEWSEKDEKMINALNNCVDELVENHNWNYVCVETDNIPVSKVRNWLKSLRSKPLWKPSEEQMRALVESISELDSIDDKWHEKISTCLESLYNDLKEL